jgi:hypothetical protein
VLLDPSIVGAAFEVSVLTEAGKRYVLEAKERMEDPAWTVLSAVTGNGSAATVSDTSASSRQRFYRVRVQGASPE